MTRWWEWRITQWWYYRIYKRSDREAFAMECNHIRLAANHAHKQLAILHADEFRALHKAALAVIRERSDA